MFSLFIIVARVGLICRCASPGCVVKHWSPLLATSKAQQLLFRIVDGLLLPPKVPQQDRALRDSLPLYLQVRTDICWTPTRKTIICHFV